MRKRHEPCKENKSCLRRMVESADIAGSGRGGRARWHESPAVVAGTIVILVCGRFLNFLIKK
ncbi:hypothetical protein [Prevotella sp. KH2C16]|uniref:hypothetical protein n=1 Tax=Prevotella sp. KH2C16 TaxID=1855325 RepID=UPI001160712A|nr:hypothetical protein [Prevotella sp. KH2C16]